MYKITCYLMFVLVATLSAQEKEKPTTPKTDPSKSRRALRFSTDLKNMSRGATSTADRLPTIDGTEAAVVKAIDWLTSEQQEEGYWEGPMSKVANTGLVTLCYLSYGVLPEDDTKYGKALSKAVDWLAKQPNEFGDMRDGGRMYDQAIGTLALSELFILTKDEKYKKPLTAAVEFLSKAQHPELGGWRYTPHTAGSTKGADLSVSGYVYCALQSAKEAGINMPNGIVEKANKYLNELSAGEEKGLYGYSKPKPKPTMTAVGMLCRQLDGSGLDARQSESAEYLATHLPEPEQQLPGTGYYHYWYFGTMAMCLYGGDEWATWHNRLIPIMLYHQEKEGNWESQGKHASKEGTVVSTAWSTLCLTIYYKCLPMLQKGNKRPSPGILRRTFYLRNTARHQALRPNTRNVGATTGRAGGTKPSTVRTPVPRK